MPISTTLRVGIIIVIRVMFGYTLNRGRGHGWICREATIPSKFGTKGRVIKGAIITTDSREIDTIVTINSTTDDGNMGL